MRYPLPELGMQKFGSRASRMAYISYLVMWLFILWTLIGHIIDEAAPVQLTYVDSFGPPVNASYFVSTPGSTGWDQSHDGEDLSSMFYGGNSTSWSDCFTVQVPKSPDGHISQWWREKESKALRVLAGL